MMDAKEIPFGWEAGSIWTARARFRKEVIGDIIAKWMTAIEGYFFSFAALFITFRASAYLALINVHDCITCFRLISIILLILKGKHYNNAINDSVNISLCH